MSCRYNSRILRYQSDGSSPPRAFGVGQHMLILTEGNEPTECIVIGKGEMVSNYRRGNLEWKMYFYHKW